MKQLKVTLCVFSLVLPLIGCVNNADDLGAHVTKLRAEQIYNPNATLDNLGVIPSGSGERMEGSYQAYTGKEKSDLEGTDSQFLQKSKSSKK